MYRKHICFWFAFVYLSLGLFATVKEANLNWAKNVGARIEPNETKEYNVDSYGAVANDSMMNTVAIQKTIDACNANGGGIVTFSSGKYRTGALFLKDNVKFRIPKGTTIIGSEDLKDYPEIDTRVAGIEMKWPAALINVCKAKNVLVEGEGTVFASGKVSWNSYWTMRKDYESRGLRWIVDYDCKRVRTVLVSESTDVTVRNIVLQQAGFWTIQILYSSYCTIKGVIIQNNIGGKGPSTDGIDIDSSNRILVEGCDIDCNDDNFCLKAGRDADGLRVNRPTEYIVIRNCVSRSGGGLFTCGSETSGGIRYVLVENLKAYGTQVGIRLKSAMNRGGTIEHIYIRNIIMDKVGLVFEATLNWNPQYSYSKLPSEYEGKELPEHWKKMLEPVSKKLGTPHFNDVHLSHFTISRSGTFMKVAGSKESLITDFELDSIHADVEKSGSVQFASNWNVRGVKLNSRNYLPVEIGNSINVSFPYDEINAKRTFPQTLFTPTSQSTIVASSTPEFGFFMPEMAGNLKFGVVVNNESRWCSHFASSELKGISKNQLIYTLRDSILGNGQIRIHAVSLSKTEGVVIEIEGDNLPQDIQLVWAYGGAYGKVLTKAESPTLLPRYCANNVFSVEQSAFTLYYGESMNLKVIHAVMPVSSTIRLVDAFMQDTPMLYFNSSKRTVAPALAGELPLSTSKKEYICIYKQNKHADYNRFMLPALFKQEAKL